MKKNESNPHIPLTNTEMVEYTKVKSVTIKVFSILMIIFLVATIIALVTFYFIINNKQTISNGVFIKDIDVSGLTKKEAIEKVQSHLDEIMNETVTLDYNNKQYYVEVEQIEATFDIESAVDTAFSIGRNDTKGIFIYDLLSARRRYGSVYRFHTYILQHFSDSL